MSLQEVGLEERNMPASRALASLQSAFLRELLKTAKLIIPFIFFLASAKEHP